MAASSSIPIQGGLFNRERFWVHRKVPQRDMIKKMITSQGGTIVMMEKDADVLVVDHMKPNLREIPLNTVSFTYIEQSVQNNKLEDFAKHRVKSTAPRPMGASHIPRKGTRQEYTLQDDQLLFDWLHPHEKQGAPVSGNKIFQDIAQRYPHHTWQSWRTRYLRTVRGKPRPGGGVPRTDVEVPHEQQLQLAPPPQSAPGQVALPAKNYPLKAAASTWPPSPSRIPAAYKPTRNPEPAKRKRTSSSSSSSSSSSEDHDLAGQAMIPLKKSGLYGIADAINVVTRDPSNSTPYRSREKLSIMDLPNSGTTSRSARQTQKAHSQASPLKQPNTRDGSQEESRASKQLNSKSDPSLPKFAEEQIAEPPVLYFLDVPHCSSGDESADDENEDEDEDESDSDEDEVYDNIEDWVHAQMDRWKFDEKTVQRVLICTSNNPFYAKRALAKWVPGQIIPDMRGVWTKEDDESLEAPNGRLVEQVIQKHGEYLCHVRLKYLQRAREAGVLL